MTRFMRHQDLPERWKARVTELAMAQSDSKFKTFGAHGFGNQHLRITFDDGSYVFFRYAFCLTDSEANEIAIFTEHCGYHIFPAVGTIIEVVTSEPGHGPLAP